MQFSQFSPNRIGRNFQKVIVLMYVYNMHAKAGKWVFRAPECSLRRGVYIAIYDISIYHDRQNCQMIDLQNHNFQIWEAGSGLVWQQVC